MTYQVTVEALQTRILADGLTGFDAKDIAIGNYDLLNGSHRYVVVLDYEALNGERATIHESHYHDWTIQIMLAVPYQNAQQAHDDMATIREHVLAQIGKRPDQAVAGNLVNAEVLRGQALPDLIEWGGANWQAETLSVLARELAEYNT